MYLLFLSVGPLRLKDYNNTGRLCTCVLKTEKYWMSIIHLAILFAAVQLQVNLS